MAFTTLSTSILKIAGANIGSGGTIAAGTSLSKATLTTIDQDSGPLGPLQLNPDPYTLVAGEALSWRINGVEKVQSLPNLFATSVTTNAGTFAALAFTLGGDTYLIPRGSVDISGVTGVTQTATLNSVPVTSITGLDYGLIPENASTFSGQYFTETSEFGLVSRSVSNTLLYDADRIRGNADSVGEEIAKDFRVGEAKEISASLTFKDGSVLTGVEGLVVTQNAAYATTTNQFVFNDAKLAAAGKTQADIAQVNSTTAIDHALNWEELGFDFVKAGNGVVTADPPALPPLNQIFGTKANDTITGTAGRDAIHGLAGNDIMQGGAGNDGFVFGAETVNGKRESDTIRNYEVGKDGIYFEDAAVVRSVVNITGGVRIIFAGDGDRVDVLGIGVNTTNVGIFADDFLV